MDLVTDTAAPAAADDAAEAPGSPGRPRRRGLMIAGIAVLVVALVAAGAYGVRAWRATEDTFTGLGFNGGYYANTSDAKVVVFDNDFGTTVPTWVAMWPDSHDPISFSFTRTLTNEGPEPITVLGVAAGTELHSKRFEFCGWNLRSTAVAPAFVADRVAPVPLDRDHPAVIPPGGAVDITAHGEFACEDSQYERGSGTAQDTLDVTASVGPVERTLTLPVDLVWGAAVGYRTPRAFIRDHVTVEAPTRRP